MCLTRRERHRPAKRLNRLSCHKLRRNWLNMWRLMSYKCWGTSLWMCSPIKASAEIPVLIPVLLVAPATMTLVVVVMVTILVPVRVSWWKAVTATTVGLRRRAIPLVLTSRRRVVRRRFDKWTLRRWLRIRTISSGSRSAVIPFKWSLARGVWCWVRVCTTTLLWCRNRSICISLNQKTHKHSHC